MGEERRKYYRYPATDGSEAVVVRHHGVERPARLVNLSSDGFRVDLDEESIVEVGDIVLMATSNGFHRVRVVNVSRENGALQLGLQRLQDLPASALEKYTEAERRPRRARGLKDTLSQLAIPIALGVMILGGVVWAWTTEADPVGAVVDDRFVTPTSNYSARRRRELLDTEETTSSGLRQKRRPVGVVAEGSSDTSQWRPGRSDVATDSRSRSDRADDPRGFADAGPGESIRPAGAFFDPSADGALSISAALSTAKREHKHVLVEFGANQCDSCSLLNAAFTQDAEISATVKKAFVFVLVDIDSNQKLATRYLQNEMRDRVPFLALLNKEGKVLKRQRTDELGAGSKLDVGKVKEFLQQWSSAG
jgi:Thioredoxin-like